jgi:hypothetical protein
MQEMVEILRVISVQIQGIVEYLTLFTPDTIKHMLRLVHVYLSAKFTDPEKCCN